VTNTPLDPRGAALRQLSGSLLRFLQQLHSEAASPWLELELTMPQLKLLLVADCYGAAPMNQVAAQLRIGLSAATGLVERLEEQGMVRREHDHRDRRVVRVIITPAGFSVVQRLRSAGSERVERILNHLSANEMERCLSVMESLNRAAENEFRSGTSKPAVASVGTVEA
jgi:DNA-binding MarR family transcriptional regulator